MITEKAINYQNEVYKNLSINQAFDLDTVIVRCIDNKDIFVKGTEDSDIRYCERQEMIEKVILNKLFRKEYTNHLNRRLTELQLKHLYRR
jgi:U3 small nucleolar ribonucleoprotein component